ncbi:unnamed protein product [Brachionus calyciflorus]|uniref:Equilibrative nucleoside transporter 1 n=1 Tax=Brachionus calyciflorus TaxID=104777 RepID=A0A813ZZM7_9BILA|nr:unnamed protein product [Brachionus calyciflorus]
MSISTNSPASSFKKRENAEKIIEELSLAEDDPQPLLNDRLNLVLIVYFFYGMASIFPWYILLTANDFIINVKLNTPISAGSFYQVNFAFISNIIWNGTFLFMTIFNLINCDKRFNQIDRIPFSLIISAISLAFLIVLSILESKTWSNSLFICLCLIIFLTAALNGVFFSSAIYASAMLPSKYSCSILVGYSFAGLLYCLICIIYKCIEINNALVAIFFFVVSFGLILVTFIAHFSLPLSNFYRYHLDITKDNMLANEKNRTSLFHMPYFRTLKKFWPLYLCIWLLMFTTMSSFSSYQQNIKQISSSQDSFIIPNKWYTDITCNLTFYLTIFLGCLTSLAFRKPSTKWVLVLSLLKSILTICFFIFCNYEPTKRKNLPVLIDNDYTYWSVSFITHYLTGLFVSLLMSFSPKEIKQKYKHPAALLTAFSFIFGSVCGSEFSRVFETLVVLI